MLPEYLRRAARAAEDWERQMRRLEVIARSTDEMLRSRFEPILRRFARSMREHQQRHEAAAKRQRKRRHQRTGRGYR